MRTGIIVIALLVFVFCVLIVPFKSYAKSLPVYSANGFQCSESPLRTGNLNLVTCAGSFPKDDGNLTASGYASVALTYGKKGHVYSYSSLTGCLMDATPKATKATNRLGQTATFPAGDFSAANDFCSK